MTSPTVSANAYTHTPKLHPNLLLSSLQLFAWLIFHPSAWRNHVARLDPTLRPDFALAELSREQWRNPALHRLLLIGYVILPVLTSLTAGLIRWSLGLSGGNIGPSMLDSLLFGLATGVAVGMTVNVGVGIVYGVAISLAIGVAPNDVGQVMAGFETSNATGVTLASIGGLMRGILLGLAAGVAGNVAINIIADKQGFSITRRAGGLGMGLLISSIFLGLGYAIASGIVLGLPEAGRVGAAADVASSARYGLASGALFCLVYSLTVGTRTNQWPWGLIIGGAIGIGGGAAYSIAISMASNTIISHIGSVAGGLLFGIMFALPYVLAERIAGSGIAAVTGALVSGLGWVLLAPFIFAIVVPLWPTLLFTAFTISLGLTLSWWRPLVLYPFLTVWNSWLYRADNRRPNESPSLLPKHTAFWDEHQYFRLSGLEEHLLLVMERNPTEGQAAIEYLTGSRQHWAAQAAQIELEARWLENCTDVETIGSIHRSLSAGQLAGPASALLRSFSRLSQDVMAALQQSSAYNQRLVLNATEDRLNRLLRELTRSSERYAVRFRPIASKWRKIVTGRVQELAQAVELRQEIDNPYIVGIPLTEQQEIFVGRTDISARIEQLLLDRRRPPLLLYGQRRMGKTSLLYNLGRLLPGTVVPLFIDLQGPASQVRDHTGFFYNIARGVISSARRQRNLELPPLPRDLLAVDPFTYFDEWLDEVEQVLGQHTALVTLDEFEALDEAIAKGNIDGKALLSMMRHLIQHRPRFKILLTSSQTPEAFQHWSGYLINLQVLHLSYLNHTEARQLIERPTRDFALSYEPEASRRVLDLTRGHPFLVQLLCSEIVALKNEQDPKTRRLASLADVEAAIPETLSRGSFFFADIERNQIDAVAKAVLGFLAAQGEGGVVSQDNLAHHFSDELDQALALLTQRELIESTETGFCFQVELIRRWFART